ncbi:hypothetical protein RvY_03577 [Ramazzottius varieornatus]|uniref:Uncharacterized protein n=1 Tax=Ramazzottius varieornatus TaxID=947166 RepID=A0A1D1USA1_RAMVA|nr:hypothetical protein RvY_03577 [Ramazzottius varieornatus]
MTGAYAPYQMPGLTTGFLMGFPLGPPFCFSPGPSAGTPLLGTLAQPRFTADEWLILQGMTANQLATAATQPAAPSINPGAPAIQPSSLRVSQASSYHASAVINSPVGTGRPDVKINLGSIGPPRKPFDHQTEVGATVGVAVLMAALTDAVLVEGAAMALDGAVDVAVDVAATREVDVIVTDDGKTTPGTAEEGDPRKAARTWTRRARRINSRRYYQVRRASPIRRRPSRRTAETQPHTWTEHQTGNDGASRTWKWTSEHLD